MGLLLSDRVFITTRFCIVTIQKKNKEIYPTTTKRLQKTQGAIRLPQPVKDLLAFKE